MSYHKMSGVSRITVHTLWQTATGFGQESTNTFFTYGKVTRETRNLGTCGKVERSGTYGAIHFAYTNTKEKSILSNNTISKYGFGRK